jgi:ParB family transcriptional regulator, chromosome partitioning protein
LSTAPSHESRGLGRGLEVLLGGDSPAELVQVPVGAIRPNPRQPRRRFRDEALADLAASVRVQGVVQPILVRPLGAGMYELVAGERRWRAARAAGLATVPALVREADERDSLLVALVENAAREDLSPLEEARAYAVLQDEFAFSLGEIAERVGRSKPAVSNKLRLLELPDDVSTLLDEGALSEGHARALLSVPDHEERRRLARRVVREGLSVRAVERAAQAAGARRKPRRYSPVDPELAARARVALEQLTGRPVRVTPNRLELAFVDETDLAELVEGVEAAAANMRAAGD